MQTLFIFLSLICFWTNALLADTISKEPIKVETLVSEIKNATPENKRILMNQLKLKLRAMNQQSRAKAMMSLRKSFGHRSQQGEKHHNKMMHQEKAHTPQHTEQRASHNGMHQGQQRGKR